MSCIDWRRARHAGKRPLSTKDEDEFRGADAAARWLAKREKPAQKTKISRARKVGGCDQHPLTTVHAPKPKKPGASA